MLQTESTNSPTPSHSTRTYTHPWHWTVISPIHPSRVDSCLLPASLAVSPGSTRLATWGFLVRLPSCTYPFTRFGTKHISQRAMCIYYYLHYHHIPPCMRDIEYAIHYNFCPNSTWSTVAAPLSPTGDEPTEPQCMSFLFQLDVNGSSSLAPCIPCGHVSFFLFLVPQYCFFFYTARTSRPYLRKIQVTLYFIVGLVPQKEKGAPSRTPTRLKPPLHWLAGLHFSCSLLFLSNHPYTNNSVERRWTHTKGL